MDRRRGGSWPVLSLVAVVLLGMLPGCSTGGAARPPTATPTAGPTATAPLTAVQDIAVRVAGRRIAGECSGSAPSGTPTVVLDSGQGSDRSQLAVLRDALVKRTRVCSYDRAGSGASDAATKPRPITDLVSDLHGWLARGGVPGPYLLVGQSQGGMDAVLFAVTHPSSTAGFVAMNPGAPCSLYLRTVKKVETRAELADEVSNCEGQNDEGVDLRPADAVLRARLPKAMPFAVLYGFACNGDAFCERVRPVESAGEAALARIGAGGRFIDVAGADHEIYLTHLAAVLRAIDQVLAASTRKD